MMQLISKCDEWKVAILPRNYKMHIQNLDIGLLKFFLNLRFEFDVEP